MNYWMFVIPLTTAITGWLTVWTALRLLFYPTHPFTIAGLTVYGFVPKNKNRYAGELASMVNNAFLSPEEISRHLSDLTILRKITPELEKHIDHFLRVKLKQTMPVVGMLIGDRTINQLKEVFMKELELLFPVVMKNYTGHLKDDLFIEELVKDKLLGYSTDDIRNLLENALSKELRYLKILGLLVGTAIGLIQVALIFIFTR